MRRKIVISLVICVVVAAIALTASRIEPVTIPYAAVTTDNSGGAIVLYPLYRVFSLRGPSAQFYVQRISSEGDFLLGGKGTLVGAGSWRGYGLRALSDGSGGAIVMWVPWNRGPLSVQAHVAKIDSGGCVEWQRDTPGAEKAIPDGSGGVIVAFGDSDGNIAVLKIDAEGNLPWGEDGVSLSLPDRYFSGIASDNLGGVIVAQVVVDEGHIIRAQRVDSDGNALWQPGGVKVCACTGGALLPQVTSDGAGGAIVAYNYRREEGGKWDIYAQRIDADGNVLWGPDGVPICMEVYIPHEVGMVEDGAGGAIIFYTSRLVLRAQRIDADGYKLWDEYSLRGWENTYHHVVSDGSGGAINVGARRAQRIDATGGVMWGHDGTMVLDQPVSGLYSISADGCGGILISWVLREFESGPRTAYVQRVDPEGKPVWGDEGIPLNRLLG